jgi:hypothetical protein
LEPASVSALELASAWATEWESESVQASAWGPASEWV